MAKIRKLLKALEAEGWRIADKRGDLVQLSHADRPGRLTLPGFKADLPAAVARDFAAHAGLKPNALKTKGGE